MKKNQAGNSHDNLDYIVYGKLSFQNIFHPLKNNGRVWLNLPSWLHGSSNNTDVRLTMASPVVVILCCDVLENEGRKYKNYIH